MKIPSTFPTACDTHESVTSPTIPLTHSQLAIKLREEIFESLESAAVADRLIDQTEDFGRAYRIHLRLHSDTTSHSDRELAEFARQETHLNHAVGDFCEGLEAFDAQSLPDFTIRQRQALSDLRSQFDPDLLRRLAAFHDKSEAAFNPVYKSVAREGIFYLLDSHLKATEHSSSELEFFLNTVRAGSVPLSNEIQDRHQNGQPTPSNHVLVKRMGEIASRHVPAPGGAEAMAHYEIAHELSQGVLAGLGREPTEVLKHRLLSLIRLNLNGLGSGLAGQTLPLFGIEDIDGSPKRVLTLMSPPKVLEFFFGILNRGMGLVSNLRLQQALLGGDPNSNSSFSSAPRPSSF